ncbi:Uncharacterized protein FWK35_00027084 [Aphis craccivora]|uniref:Uncharacterized protein n=1 Tax=Aphis craccivora TaxID=307492 RepID=A0A6G0VLY0_APHCR|nr:Uncharacterized protein FWK35_00027084 [Aphis craccivora]
MISDNAAINLKTLNVRVTGFFHSCHDCSDCEAFCARGDYVHIMYCELELGRVQRRSGASMVPPRSEVIKCSSASCRRVDSIGIPNELRIKE